MGVPKFYRWISERYPCLSEIVKENQIPEFDNLYLDMNGIIHPCSHPNDDDVHFRITEQKIYENIFNYIEVLFRIIKPRKVFFMAVDGVAPRAKMNQQRGRRFRSANEAEAKEKEAVRKGETLPDEKRFDSNCITPGTHFMARLNEQLKYFVNKKVTQDRSWQGIRIFLSGHETPGEGEHKIMDFIRSEKLRPDYDANTRHCLYGLDADLMMLGLASHEPHFSLLREEVKFGKVANSKRPTTAEETTFHLLHLSLFREYLDAEFSSVRPQIPDYDPEKIIDDWVFMGFLVGNDFIPHLPDLHINQAALPLLYQTYVEVRPQMDGYLNENGTLNLKNFEKYITKLSQFDRDKFEEQFVDLSFFAEKKETGKGKAWQSERVNAKKEAAAKKLDNSFAVLQELEDDPDWPDAAPSPGAAVPANIAVPLDAGDEDDEEEEDQFELEFRLHKYDYYQKKFGIETVAKAHVHTIATEYVRALQWILHYYFNGIQSWGWYYPYHYAPYMSDLKDFSKMNMAFDKGTPFLPFQQLLGVLPAASRECLPDTYQSLMIMDNSPIIDFYPVDFEQDLNGKMQSWEAVVLIPFINEERLLEAMAARDKNLTAEERGRNLHSPHLCYTYDENLNFNYPSSCVGSFPDIAACHARCEEIHKAAHQHHPSKLSRGLRKGVKLGVYFPGFPTLHHLSYTTELSKEEVKIFQQNSRGENMIITVKAKNSDSFELETIANDILGKTIYAEWPHLKEVRVIAVTAPNAEYRYELAESTQRGSKATEQISYKRVPMTEDDRIQWVRDVKNIAESYHKRKGVKIGKTEVLVYACPLMGRRYICGHSGMITLEKQWSSNPVTYAYQMTVKDIAVHDSTFQQFKTLEEIFPKESACFMLGTPNYGCEGKVLEVEDGRVRVLFTIPYEPTFDHIKNKMHQYDLEYFPGYQMAKRMSVSSLIVSRITGTMFMERGNKHEAKKALKALEALRASTGTDKDPESNTIFKPTMGNRVPIGLNLKFNKADEEVPGYTRKGDDERRTWLYSTQVEEVLREYMQKFPEMFEYISNHQKADTYYEADVFGEDNDRLKELQEWLKALECNKVGKVKCGHKNVSEQAVKLIEEDIATMAEGKKKSVRKMKLFIRPHLLYRPLDHQGNLIPDPDADYQLFDRVVNVREGYTVPLGLKGVVIGVQQTANVLDSLYDVIFDEEFQGGLTIRCKGSRGYRMPPTALINLSVGLRKESGTHRRPTAVVKPQFSASPRTPHTQSSAYYSNMMGKLGTQNNQGGQRSQDGYNQHTPRNQRTNSRNQTPEQFHTPRTQVDSSPYSTPYSTPYQQTPPTSSPSRNRPSSSGARENRSTGRTPSQMNQDETPQFTLLTKAKETNQRSSQPQSRKSTTNTVPKESTPSRPVVESSSNYARVLKNESSSSDKAPERKTESAPRQSQQIPDQRSMNLNQRSQNSGQRLHYSGQSSQTINNAGTEADEFANLWKQLQSSDNENSAPNTPARNKTVQGDREIRVEPSMQMNNENIPFMPKGVADLTVSEKDRMSPNTFTKTGTEELCRLLNITSVSKTTQESTPSESSSSIEASPKSDSDHTPATPSYGVPLTLDQLFSGALPTQNPSSSEIQPSVPHQPTQQAQQPQHTVPIGIPGAGPPHQYPVVPIASQSPQIPSGHGLIPGSSIVAPGASPLAASTTGSSSSGSPSGIQFHAQQMPVDPRTPPRQVPTNMQYEGPPVMSYQGPRGPQQAPPLTQQFRMPGQPLRGPPMVNRAPLPPGMASPGPTYTQMLHMWCMQHGLRPPQIEFYGNQKTGTVRASVQLPNGPKIVGPDGVNQPAAADMASHILLNKLDPSKFGMPGMRGPAPGPLPTPGSPHQPPPHGSPHQPPPHGSPRQPPHGSPHQAFHGQPPARYPLFPEQQMGPRPIRPTIGPGGVGLQWQHQQRMATRPIMMPPAHAGGVPPGSPGSPQVVIHARGSNPFVPLQVTRQLTPRKSQDDDSDVPSSPRFDSSFPIPTTPNHGQPLDPAAMVTPPRNYPAAPVTKEIPVDYPKSQDVGSFQATDERTIVEQIDSAIVSASLESSGSKTVMSKPRRKPSKAKLAINFGGGN